MDLGTVLIGAAVSKSFTISIACGAENTVVDVGDGPPFSLYVTQAQSFHGFDVKVTFQPTAAGPVERDIHITVSSGEKHAIALSGKGSDVGIICAPDTLGLTRKMQSADVTCTSAMPDPVHLTTAFVGAHAGRFYAPVAVDLDPQGSSTFSVSFQPSGDLVFVTTLNISTGDTVPIASIQVTGDSSVTP